MNLMPENKFHFEEDGVTEKNNDINLKKNVMTLDTNTVSEKRVLIERIQKLPCIKIRPLNAKEIEAMRIQKGNFNSNLLTNKCFSFHMSKLTWMDAHKRLGCPADAYLKLMAERKMIVGLDQLLPFPRHGVKQFCECMIGQATKSTRMIPMKSNRLSGAEEMSMDIGGPWPVQSINGETYWNLMKLKHSHLHAIYFMKTKDEIVKVMDTYCIDMGKHAEELGGVAARLELISSDKDSNYFSEQMQQWCRSKGIKQFSSAPYAHAFNSAESSMRQVKEKRSTTCIKVGCLNICGRMQCRTK
jgi:hypothetical protein